LAGEETRQNETRSDGAGRPRRMSLRRPAVRWQDALPCGNGTLGAMVYGSIVGETVMLNHEAIWDGGITLELPNLAEHLDELRSMLLEGRYAEAEALYAGKCREAGYVARTGYFQPAFDLKIAQPLHAPFRHYRRSLDFERGVATVRWNDGDRTFIRELFVSRADDVVALRLKEESGTAVSAEFALAPHDLNDAVSQSGKPLDVPFRYTSEIDDAEAELRIVGTRPDGSAFGALAVVRTLGGTLRRRGNALAVEDAAEIVVLIDLFPKGECREEWSRLRSRLRAIGPDYDALLERHVRSHRKLFLRSRISLAAERDRREADNEYLLLDAYGGGADQALYEKLFDYGKYLLMASSRPGGLPANLQGVWNGDYAPAWSSAFFANENIQMNYWQALPGNMAETLLPLFDFLESLLPDMRENAAKFYGCRGILAPLFASPDSGLKKNLQPHVLYWTAGAGWLAQHFYDYYLYTGDLEFLRNRAVPFMKECALFYEDFLIRGPDGRYMFAPSNSPENRANGSFEGAGELSVCLNATMDYAVAKEVLTHLCRACRLLGIEGDAVPRWEAMAAEMPPYEVNEDGALREWMHPDFLDNYRHRHLSHLYPLFPGYEITEESSPQLFAACREAVRRRLVIGLKDQTGWSLAHMANLYARMGMGDEALECLNLLVRSCLGDNLFTYHNDWRKQGMTMDMVWGKSAPFQIDANMGIVSAILEMLVFSSPGWIKLLPALPAAWPKGEADGLLCRGGVEVSVKWDMPSGLVEAVLTARSPKTDAVTVKLPAPFELLEPSDHVRPSSLGPAYASVSFASAGEVRIRARLHEREARDEARAAREEISC